MTVFAALNGAQHGVLLPYPMEVPDEFVTIESGLYRIRSFDAYALPFLESLRLRTIIVLDSGTPGPLVRDFAKRNSVRVVHFGTEPWRSQSEVSQQHHYWSVLSEAMKYILDTRHYPLLILGNNVLTGIVRRVENITLSAILAEFNSQSSVRAHVSLNYEGSVFLELLRLRFGKVADALTNIEHLAEASPCTPVITLELPCREYVPDWVSRFAPEAVIEATQNV